MQPDTFTKVIKLIFAPTLNSYSGTVPIDTYNYNFGVEGQHDYHLIRRGSSGALGFAKNSVLQMEFVNQLLGFKEAQTYEGDVTATINPGDSDWNINTGFQSLIKDYLGKLFPEINKGNILVL